MTAEDDFRTLVSVDRHTKFMEAPDDARLGRLELTIVSIERDGKAAAAIAVTIRPCPIRKEATGELRYAAINPLNTRKEQYQDFAACAIKAFEALDKLGAKQMWTLAPTHAKVARIVLDAATKGPVTTEDDLAFGADRRFYFSPIDKGLHYLRAL